MMCMLMWLGFRRFDPKSEQEVVVTGRIEHKQHQWYQKFFSKKKWR